MSAELFEFEDELQQPEPAMPTLTITPQKRPAKRGDDYYWQLYFDYTTAAEPAHAGEAASHTSNGHHNGSHANGGDQHNGNGSHSSVDMAITETVPLTLFGESEMGAADSATEADEAGAAKPEIKSAGNYNEFEFELIDDPSRLAQVAEMLARETVLGIDTETTGLDPYIAELLLLQLSTTDKVYIVDCKRLVPLALKPLLENPDILKIAQNAKFEYSMLKQQAGITLAGIYDTMLAERLCTAGIGREISLKQIAAKYIGAVLDKTQREAFYKLTNIGDAYLAPEQLHYAARDAFIMIPIWHLQKKELKRHNLEQVADMEFRCVAAVGDLELAGVKIDETKWRKIIEDVGVQRERSAAELCEMLQPATMQATMFGVPSINLNSSTQLMEVFAKMGVELLDTSEATLSKVNHPAVAKLLEYRSFEKTLSAFGENVLSLINPKTGRIHPDFNQHGADTGRFSCTRPNVQQIPATSDFRTCFIAPEGYKLVTCDYSQAELRILAELSLDPAFVGAFRSGGDLHAMTASQMFNVPLEEVQKPQRSAAKAINFGLAYGMGPGGLAPRLGVTLDEAKGLIARYFKAYPGVQAWLDKAAKDAVRLGYSVTNMGRKRFYTLPDESLKRSNEDEWRKQISAIERQGKNSPIQGCLKFDTRVFEETKGYVPIESLRGDVVSVWDGSRFSKAVVVYSGKKQLVRVTLRGGHYIECSPDHKFLVACNNGYKWVWKWKPASDIKAQNRVALAGAVGEWHLPFDAPQAVRGTAHNANAASIADVQSPSYMGEWLGRLASDGSIGKNNAITMLVAEHEEGILPHLEGITRQMGAVAHSVRVTPTQPQRFHLLTICSKSLSDQLRTTGVKEGIPAFVWRDSTLLAAYLRGLFDGDGTVHPDGALLVFGQGDKHLGWAREVQEALLLFGIRSRINVYTNKHHRINLRVLKRDMPLFCEKIGFSNPIKQQKAVQIRSERWARVSPQYGMAMLVESVEVTDEYVDMYDVVNSETGRFMANGMVVHNCNADMTKLALIYIRNALKDWDARTVNTVHDEIVVEVRADQAEEVKHIVEACMVRAGEDILKEVPIVAEASLADYWSK